MTYYYNLDLVNLLAAKNDYVEIPAGPTTASVRTLETTLSQFAATAVRVPNTMRGQDPIEYFIEFAQLNCNAVPTPDCSAQHDLALKYGQIVKDALAAAGWTGFEDKTAPYQLPVRIADPSATPAPTPVTAPDPNYIPPPSSAPAAVLPTFPPPGTTPGPASASAPAPAPAPVSQPSPVSGVQPRFLSGGLVSGGIGIAGTVGLALSGVLTFGISTVIGFLGSLLGSLLGGGGDVDALRKEVQQLKNDLATATHEIGRFAWSVAFGLGNFLTAFAGIWDNFFDQLWSRFKDVWKVVWDTVATVIPKIINTMKKIRQKLDEIYAKYLLPIMRWLQFARRWMAILKLLHVPFASKLDRIIGQIQSALYMPMLYVLRWVGGLASWYNLVVAWDYTIQRPVFLRSMYKYQGDWINMFWTAQTSTGVSAPDGGSADDLPGETPRQAAMLLASSLGTPVGLFLPDDWSTQAGTTANILAS